MNWNLENILKALKEKNLLSELSRGRHGIERETLRINKKGELSLKPHPKSLGDDLTNPHITTDFSESQLELITDAHPTIKEAIAELNSIHQQVAEGLENEWMWPFSMPCILPEAELIPIAYYGESAEAKMKTIYRRGLAERYGKYMQMLCGIHYNVSFSDELWKRLHQWFGKKETLQEFKNQKHLQMMRSFIEHRWILAYLTGATPVKHDSYGCKGVAKFDHKNAISLRLSRCGYDNPASVKIDYNEFKSHLKSIQKAVDTPYAPYTEIGIEKEGVQIQLNDHLLQIPNEYYFPIRLKPKPHKDGFLEGLKQTGVEYVEVRMLDVNPLKPEGVSAEELMLTHLFLIYCLLKEEVKISEKELKKGSEKQQLIAFNGRKPLPKKYQEEGLKILKKLKELSKQFNQDYQEAIDHYQKEFKRPQNLIWKKTLDEMKEFKNDFIKYGLEKAKAHFNDLKNG